MANKTVTVSKTLKNVTAILDNFPKLSKKADSIFRKFTTDIFIDIIFRSPVDKGSYRADWEYKNVSEAGSMSAIRITNNMPYSGVLEAGSPVGKKPWKSAGPLTVEVGGRIWSRQMPEPVAQVAVESADWEGLEKALANIFEGEL